MITLRPYQDDAKAKVRAAHDRGQTPLLVMPTGTGKTRTFASIIHDYDCAAVAVVHRNEIVVQISEALADLGVVHRIIGQDKPVSIARRKHLKKHGRSYIDQNARVGVASVQTLTSKGLQKKAPIMAWVRQIQLAVYDEGHHYTDSGQWAKGVQMMKDVSAKLLGVTATPERADGKGLGSHASGFYDILLHAEQDCQIVDTRWAIENGYLSKFDYFAPHTDLDVEGIAVTASGEFNAQALRARTVDSHLVGDVIKHYHALAPRKKAIGFAADVATAEEMAAEARKYGYKAIALSGNTDQGERDRALEAFSNGDYDILFNVGLFDEGFDVPAVEAVLLGAPTMSLGKYLQMVGRGLRILEGKEKAIIIDPVRNWERHGMPDWPRAWTLDGKTKFVRSQTDTVPQRVCLGCTRPYEAFHPACPYCGHVHEPPERGTVDKVDGDLMLLDSDALAALFERKAAANMSRDEFAASLYQQDANGKIMPPQYHSAQIKRHESAKYRRSVLDNLIGWWVGCQPPRQQQEIQRRFYLRFGVDLLTAYSLNEKETDALIERIAKKFSEDVCGR